MVVCNEKELQFVGINPEIKSDTFVNEDYKEARVSDIGRYIAPPNKHEIIEEARKRLALID